MTAAGVARRLRATPNLSGPVPARPLVRLLVTLTWALCGLALLPSASAASSLSQNWAGYAIHGASFQSVTGSWRQPRPICPAGQTRYSAMWVGLGGYSLTAGALEQVGTELDCVRGHAASSGWYELVPGPSHTIRLGVRPGDLMTASVTVLGANVTVAINDVTRHRLFQQTLQAPTLDVSSAEWILEAPSSCIAGTAFCRTLPLADFRHAAFTNARAQQAGGTIGAIVNAAWRRTMIVLGAGGMQFVSNGTGAVAVGTARPTRLRHGGSAFSIAYTQRHVPAGTVFGPRIPSGPQSIVHRGRS